MPLGSASARLQAASPISTGTGSARAWRPAECRMLAPSAASLLPKSQRWGRREPCAAFSDGGVDLPSQPDIDPAAMRRCSRLAMDR